MLAAYGFRFSGVGFSPVSAGDVEAWPIVEIKCRSVEGTASAHLTTSVSTQSASLRYSTGSLAVDRSTSTITFHHDPPLDDDAIAHPHLAFPAAVLNHWRGRSSLHAGALVTSSRQAIVLLGDKGAGKSTTLAAAALAGHVVLADDLIVIEGRSALLGPRCIDLRPDASLHLSGRPLGFVGGRERWRIDLPPAPAETEIGAIVALTWGSDVAARRIGPVEAAQRLFDSFGLGSGPGTGDHLFELLDIPMWEVGRPRDFDAMPLLLDQINSLV